MAETVMSYDEYMKSKNSQNISLPGLNKEVSDPKPVNQASPQPTESPIMSYSDYMKNKEASQPSELESFGRGVIQGGSFGFSDEMIGGVESLFSNKTYEQARDESRKANKLAQDTNPASYLTGEIGGGVASAFIPGVGALGTAAKGATGLAKAGQIIAGSGVAGGLAGIGSSEGETVKDIGLDALQGTAFGAIGGGVLHGAGSALSAVGGKIKDIASNTKIIKNFTDTDTVIVNMAKVANAQAEKDFGKIAKGGVSEVEEHLASMKAGPHILDTKKIKDYNTAYTETDRVLDLYGKDRSNILKSVQNPEAVSAAAERIQEKLMESMDNLIASDTALTKAEIGKINDTFEIAFDQLSKVQANSSSSLPDIDKIRKDFYNKITDKEWIEGAKTVKEAPKLIGDTVLRELDDVISTSQPQLEGRLKEVGQKMNAAMELKESFAKGAVQLDRKQMESAFSLSTGVLGGMGIAIGQATGLGSTAGLAGAFAAKQGLNWFQTPAGKLTLSHLVDNIGEKKAIKMLSAKGKAIEALMQTGIPEKAKMSLLRKMSGEYSKEEK